jgi:hypothetical protein
MLLAVIPQGQQKAHRLVVQIHPLCQAQPSVALAPSRPNCIQALKTVLLVLKQHAYAAHLQIVEMNSTIKCHYTNFCSGW